LYKFCLWWRAIGKTLVRMGSTRLVAVVLGLVAALAGCRRGEQPQPRAPGPQSRGGGGEALAAFATFADDVAFLSRHAPIKILASPQGGRVAVSSTYQGRVMTSAVEPGGASLGFINRAFIERGQTGTAFDNYGGEDRFWLGPEAGQYGLYFPRGKPFVFANWQTPHGLQEGVWEVEDESATAVTFRRTLSVTNYAGTGFDVRVERRVALLSPADLGRDLGITPPPSVKWIAFSTSNAITNLGASPWTLAKGVPSVWILGMFAPAADTRVVIPFEKTGAGEIVNDRYFGKVPPDRLRIHEGDGFLTFVCDGRHRSKIGLPPTRARPVLGSYSPGAALLTIVLYSRPPAATRYVNSMWETQKDPYGGDVVNSYNDGPTEPGQPSLGGFYEIESSSPAAALAPGATLTHVHSTFHFTGPAPALEAIAVKALGVSLAAL